MSVAEGFSEGRFAGCRFLQETKNGWDEICILWDVFDIRRRAEVIAVMFWAKETHMVMLAGVHSDGLLGTAAAGTGEVDVPWVLPGI